MNTAAPISGAALTAITMLLALPASAQSSVAQPSEYRGWASERPANPAYLKARGMRPATAIPWARAQDYADQLAASDPRVAKLLYNPLAVVQLDRHRVALLVQSLQEGETNAGNNYCRTCRAQVSLIIASGAPGRWRVDRIWEDFDAVGWGSGEVFANPVVLPDGGFGFTVSEGLQLSLDNRMQAGCAVFRVTPQGPVRDRRLSLKERLVIDAKGRSLLKKGEIATC